MKPPFKLDPGMKIEGHTAWMPIDQAIEARKAFTPGLEEYLKNGLWEELPDAWQVYGYKDAIAAERMIHRGVTPFMGPNQSTSQGCGITLERAKEIAEKRGLRFIEEERVWRRPTLKEMKRLKRTDQGYWEHCYRGGLMVCEPGAEVPDPKKTSKQKGIPYRANPKPGRNQPCACGSGAKFKLCCGR